MTRPAAAPAAVVLTAGVLLAGCTVGDTGSGDGSAPAPPSTASAAPSSPAPVADVPVAGRDGAEVPVPGPVADKWRATGAETGSLGVALGPASDGGTTRRVDFTGGSVFLTTAGRAFVVQGEILAAYDAAGGPAGELGAPASDETTTDGGWISAFEGGSIAYVGGRAEVARK